MQNFALDVLSQQLIVLGIQRCIGLGMLGLSGQQPQAQGRRPALGQPMQFRRPSAAGRVQLLQPTGNLVLSER